MNEEELPELVFGKKRRKKEIENIEIKEKINDEDYPYVYLLERISKNITRKDRKKLILKRPDIVRINNHKCIWSNFGNICESIHRSKENVSEFILAELCSDGNIDENRLILKTNFRQNIFENILQKYVNKFVICKECKNADTLLINENKITYLSCDTCGSKYNVRYFEWNNETL